MNRWIEFQRTIDAIDRPTSRETPLTPKKYEFLSSQMENRWTFLEYVCIYIYIYPLAIVRRDSFCRTRSYVSRGISTIPKVGSFCVQGRAFVAGQIRASFKRYLRRARGRKERTSGLLSWHEIRATPIPLLFLFFFLLLFCFIPCFYILPSHDPDSFDQGGVISKSKTRSYVSKRNARGNARSYRCK